MTERNFYILTCWEEDHEKIINDWRSHPNFKMMVMQEEDSPKTGKVHYQGAIKLDKRVTFASMKAFAQAKSKGTYSVNCKEHVDGGFSSWKRCVNYCSGNSGAGLLKCKNLNNRFLVSKNSTTKLLTSKEGQKQWAKHRQINNVIENFDPRNREHIMKSLRNQIDECKRFIMQFD